MKLQNQPFGQTQQSGKFLVNWPETLPNQQNQQAISEVQFQSINVILYHLKKLVQEDGMESKYRKLYLYASNTQATQKKPNEQYEEYKLKKQKSIEQLKQLLDSKISLPPVASLLAFQDNQKYKEKQYKSTQNKSFKILKLRSKSNSLTHQQLFLPSAHTKYQPGQPTSQRKIKIKQRQERTEKDYEKYINQYMQKLQKLNLLEKYAEQDYSKLVQDACKQIRKKINQQELEIEEVEKSLQESRDFSLLALKGKKKKQKKSKQIKKKEKEDYVEDTSTNNHFYLSNMTDRLFLHRDEHKKSKSVAQNNLYKLNLEMVEKTNALKNKARKRSEKQFVRNLARHSFGETLLPISPKQ